MTMLDSYYKGSADEESRQHYATVRIQEMQRVAIEFRHEVLPLDFSELLRAFRMFGKDYDQGFRLRNELDGAA